MGAEQKNYIIFSISDGVKKSRRWQELRVGRGLESLRDEGGAGAVVEAVDGEIAASARSMGWLTYLCMSSLIRGMSPESRRAGRALIPKNAVWVGVYF